MSKSVRRKRKTQHKGKGAERKPSSMVRMDRLARRFAAFRRHHRRGAPISPQLREAVLEAIDQGANVSDVRRACGVTETQLDRWRKGPAARARPKGGHHAPARIFPVVDEAGVTKAVGPNTAPPKSLTLHLEGWEIAIRQTVP